MKDELKEFYVKHQNTTKKTSLRRNYKRGVLNEIWPNGPNTELTETTEFDLKNFSAAVLPSLASPVPFVFVQVKYNIYVYQFGELTEPELLMDAGKSTNEITAVFIISDNISAGKCQQVINQFPRAILVNIDILGFAEDADKAFELSSASMRNNIPNLTITTHSSLYSKLDEDEMKSFEQNCLGFLKNCESMFPNLKSMRLEVPLEYELHMTILAVIENNRIFKRSSWIGGFEHNKLRCIAPITVEERRRLNPGIANVLCIGKPPVRKTKSGKQFAKKPAAKSGKFKKPTVPRPKDLKESVSESGGVAVPGSESPSDKPEPEALYSEDKNIELIGDLESEVCGIKEQPEEGEPSKGMDLNNPE